jgi:hypothetical protein
MRYELVCQCRDEKSVRLGHGTKDLGQQLTELEILRRGNCAETTVRSVKDGPPIKPDDQSVMVLTIFPHNHHRAGNEILI